MKKGKKEIKEWNEINEIKEWIDKLCYETTYNPLTKTSVVLCNLCGEGAYMCKDVKHINKCPVNDIYDLINKLNKKIHNECRSD